MADSTNITLQQILKNDSKAYIGIFVVSFCLFLLIAITAQAMTWQWRSWFAGSRGGEIIDRWRQGCGLYLHVTFTLGD